MPDAFGVGAEVRLRSGGPAMQVVDVRTDEEDGEMTVFVAWPDPQSASYFSATVLAPASAPVPPAPAPLRPQGPRPGDVVANPRAGGLMTVSHVDPAEGGSPIWAQWISPAGEYGSGSFLLDSFGRVIDYPAEGA